METEFTTADAENAENLVDNDSGIGTMSSASASPRSTPSQSMDNTPSQSMDNTPSQSMDNTPSQSMDNTPLASRHNSESDFTEMTNQSTAIAGVLAENFGTSSSTSSVSLSAQSTPVTSPRESGCESRFSQGKTPNESMETDSLPQSQRQESTGHWKPLETQRWQRAPPDNFTRTSVPVMDHRGFYQNTCTPESNRALEQQIFVRNFNGQVSTFQIGENAGVNDLKKVIHNKLGIPPSQQRLVYQGREFIDGKSLKEYGVRNLSEISLLGRLRGGFYYN